uniref:Uncharacterized protein n=1 Tax=Physcomitrium patens TaxID=3218 RepID=A0A7I4F898_PHYPA
MNDIEVSKQVQQMVQFIRQEAEEKANEISVSAEERIGLPESRAHGSSQLEESALSYFIVLMKSWVSIDSMVKNE